MAKRITMIEWVDSVSFHGGTWRDADDVKSLKPDLIVSVGFIQKETPSHVTIAAHVGGGEVSGELCIPRVSITKVRHFSIKPKKRKKTAK